MKEKYKEFAIKSFQYIIELVNDEEDEVRYKTVETLIRLIKNFKKIDFTSLEIIFFNIKEKSSKLRDYIYLLISEINCNNSKDFQTIVSNILDNLQLFKEDKLLIFKCIKDLCKVNIEFVDKDYIYLILNIDPNFLITEYDWNELSYNAILVIVQEYLLNNKELRVPIPRFIFKHLNFLLDRFPTIFDNEGKSKKEESANTNFGCLNNSQLEIMIEFEYCLDKIKKEFQSICELREANYFQIYKLIFSLIRILCVDGKYLITKMLIIVDIMEDLLNMINLKLNLESDENINSLLTLNELISYIVISEVDKKIGNTRKLTNIPYCYKTDETLIQLMKEIAENSNFNKEHLIIQAFNELCSQNRQFLDQHLLKILITNPKKNFSYVHNKSNIRFPFYLAIGIKISNFKLYAPNHLTIKVNLIKSLSLVLQSLDNSKELEIDESSIKFSDKGLVSIKCKVPIYLTENEIGEHRLIVKLKSNVKSEFNDLMQSLSLPLITDRNISSSQQTKFIISL